MQKTTVSLHAQMPPALFNAMERFIAHRPAWNRYRLMTSALAGFLIQHGIHDRDVTRCYLDGLFGTEQSQSPAPSADLDAVAQKPDPARP